MITPLRRRHRWLAPGAFAVGLLGLGAALSARPNAHIARMRPALDANDTVRSGGAARFVFVSQVHDYKLELVADEGARRLRLVPRFAGDRRPIDAPDLLLYASGAAGAASETLPVGAQFLGPASTAEPTVVPLPAGAGRWVMLYSLAHGRIVETVELPAEEGR